LKVAATIDEGKGNYGRFGKTILGSLIEEEKPILSLEDTIAKREKELEADAKDHKKAEAMAEKAKKMCDGGKQCIDKVEKKLEHGVYDKEIKELKLKAKHGKKV